MVRTQLRCKNSLTFHAPAEKLRPTYYPREIEMQHKAYFVRERHLEEKEMSRGVKVCFVGSMFVYETDDMVLESMVTATSCYKRRRPAILL